MSNIIRRARAASSWLVEQILLVVVLAFGATLALLPVHHAHGARTRPHHA
ncbi:hypothetical protein [Microbacterium pygmaeum]|uniref:Uncharacterized protein n=1 Tax=Microbacterium pygmaeum TaxID=370764 RepID=A0A1G8DWN5_9MICO|nr:hypothetical protein [Microbacterium pygmaeum]SDH62126.1 hypothetical protein SAMN04489810_3471 [Microbacterium pygmaeum]